MAVTRGLLVIHLGAALPLLLFSHEVVGEVGVNYGRVANDLPPNQASVVQLLKQNGITKLRIYDAYPPVLSSLANTGIKVMVMMPNENLADAANDPSNAFQWVQSNVAAYYPTTHIDGVAVGNEVFKSAPNLNSQLVPAMTNVQAALAKLGLADAIKVSTPIAFDALKDPSFPPSAGRFRDELQPVMKSMLDFLQRTGSYLTMNIYPFFTYAAQPDKIPLDYALGNSNPGVHDDNTGLMYYNLLDAQRDTAYYAMEDIASAMGKMDTTEASAVGSPGVSLYVTESGWPSRGRIGHGGRRRLLQDGSGAASIPNAKAYNNNLINRVLAGKTGTPHHPDATMDVYIFALFNENNKGGPDDTEANFGLFYPNMQKVYQFDFHGGGALTESWCVANASVRNAWLQAALEYACGHSADCSAIQPGAVCFEPNTKVAHASYAFNSYYQRNGRASGACDFSGAGTVVYQAPKFGNCVLPSTG